MCRLVYVEGRLSDRFSLDQCLDDGEALPALSETCKKVGKILEAVEFHLIKDNRNHTAEAVIEEREVRGSNFSRHVLVIRPRTASFETDLAAGFA